MNFAHPIVCDQRLVLFPHGQPTRTQHRDRCAEFVLWCGGDVGRVIDAPVTSIDAFARHISRIKGLRDGTERALVVLTLTNPLALTVVDMRRRLEARLGSLRAARWMIYVDPDDDPFFEPTAMRLGHLTGDLSDAPVWVGPHDSPFLVVSPELRDRDAICSGLEELDELIRTAASERHVTFRRRRNPEAV